MSDAAVAEGGDGSKSYWTATSGRANRPNHTCRECKKPILKGTENMKHMCVYIDIVFLKDMNKKNLHKKGRKRNSPLVMDTNSYKYTCKAYIDKRNQERSGFPVMDRMVLHLMYVFFFAINYRRPNNSPGRKAGTPLLSS